MDPVTQKFIESAHFAKNLEELSTLFSLALKDLGFNNWAYQLVEGELKKNKKPVILSNYPEEWVEYYMDSNYHHVDPVITDGPKEVKPFKWSDLTASHELTLPQKKLFEEANEFGLDDGLGFPMHGAYGAFAMITMVSEENSKELNKIYKMYDKEIHILTLYYNNIARELVQHDKVFSDAPVLSTREREVLLWICAGKSNWDIAQILNISESTVKVYCNRLKDKFGVSSRTEAAVEAVRKKVITP